VPVEWLTQLPLDEADISWLRRFQQPGLMVISRKQLRAVTWLAAPEQGLIEVHVHGCPYRLCDPEVLVVKAAQDGHRYNASYHLHRSAERCILAEG